MSCLDPLLTHLDVAPSWPHAPVRMPIGALVGHMPTKYREFPGGFPRPFP